MQNFSNLIRTHARAVIFGVPGAFTPICSLSHLPGFIDCAEELKKKGVEAIYCIGVNDKFVMKAWAEATVGATDSGIQFVADGSGQLTKALGLQLDFSSLGFGVRSKRYAAIVEYGTVVHLLVDEKGNLQLSTAENLLDLL